VTASVAAAQSTHDPKTFALAAAGNPAAASAAPVTLVATSDPRAQADGAIVAAVAADSAVAVTQNPNPIPPPAPPLDWDDAPFDVGIHLDMESHPMPLCHDKNESENSSDMMMMTSLSIRERGIDFFRV
jgi:hypothetical protein